MPFTTMWWVQDQEYLGRITIRHHLTPPLQGSQWVHTGQTGGDRGRSHRAAPSACLLAHPAVREVPVIVETPSNGTAGHARDIATLRDLAPPARHARTPAG